tara:strand:- start:1290 stop:2111 length:822 start_codon:yes stop_codon:yes gene_type:complete
MSKKPAPYQRQVTVSGSLLLPFGSTKKWELDRIRLQYASTSGLHFTSDVPFVHINKRAKRPLYFNDAPAIFNMPKLFRGVDGDKDERKKIILMRIKNAVSQFMEGATKYEHLFLDHYFAHFLDSYDYEVEYTDFVGDKAQAPLWMSGLLPIPQVQIYCEDPLDKRFSAAPSNNFRVDFGFWTGKELVAVEVDGYEPSGYERDLRRDRMLRRAGVDLVHILNKELEEHGRRVITKLLPGTVMNTYYSSLTNEEREGASFYLYASSSDLDDEIPF